MGAPAGSSHGSHCSSAPAWRRPRARATRRACCQAARPPRPPCAPPCASSAAAAATARASTTCTRLTLGSRRGPRRVWAATCRGRGGRRRAACCRGRAARDPFVIDGGRDDVRVGRRADAHRRRGRRRPKRACHEASRLSLRVGRAGHGGCGGRGGGARARRWCCTATRSCPRRAPTERMGRSMPPMPTAAAATTTTTRGRRLAARALQGTRRPSPRRARLVGGSRADVVPVTWRTRPIAPEVVRFYRPEAGTLGFKSVAPPTLFDELIGPDLLASTHTSTRVGGKLFVLGGHDAPRGLLGQNGGGLILSVLDLRTLSWSGRYETLQEYRPSYATAHAPSRCRRSKASPSAACAERGSPTRGRGVAHEQRAPRAPPRGVRAAGQAAWRRRGGGQSGARAGLPRPRPWAASASGGEPSRWPRLAARARGDRRRRRRRPSAAIPRPPCPRHTPGRWAGGQGAMLVVGGYTTDAFVADGAEGELAARASCGALDARWLAPRRRHDASPTPRTLHAAALLADVTGASSTILGIGGGGNVGGGAAAAAAYGVCIAAAGGAAAARSDAREPHRERNSHDAWVLTLDPSVAGAVLRSPAPPGPPPSPRAGAAAARRRTAASGWQRPRLARRRRRAPPRGCALPGASSGGLPRSNVRRRRHRRRYRPRSGGGVIFGGAAAGDEGAAAATSGIGGRAPDAACRS